MAHHRTEERIRNPESRWYFTREELLNSPSRAHGVDSDKELSYRQQAASMIQDMGKRLTVSQLCINTAIVYMHRFYTVHSFKTMTRSTVATSSLFLAAKVEEQPQPLEHVAKVAYYCMHKESPSIDTRSETYTKLVEEITYHELLILETLGFETKVVHPHTYVVQCLQLVRASKDLSRTAYFWAHNSLLLTTFCLEHRPPVVAGVVILLALRWMELEIPPSKADGKNWWNTIDRTITFEKLSELMKEFLKIYEKCPSRLKKLITVRMAAQQQAHDGDGASSSGTNSHPSPAPPLPHSRPHPHPPGSNKTKADPHAKHQAAPQKAGRPVSHTQSEKAGSGSSVPGKGKVVHQPVAPAKHKPHALPQPPPPKPNPPLPPSSRPHHPHHGHAKPHPPPVRQAPFAVRVPATGATVNHSKPLHPTALATPAPPPPSQGPHRHHHQPASSVGAKVPGPASLHRLQGVEPVAKPHTLVAAAEKARSSHYQHHSTGGKTRPIPHASESFSIAEANHEPVKHRSEMSAHHKGGVPGHLFSSHQAHRSNLHAQMAAGMKRPHHGDNSERKRLKMDQSSHNPPLPPLPSSPPPPLPLHSQPRAHYLPNQVNINRLGLPPLPPPLPSSPRGESPPPPPPPEPR